MGAATKCQRWYLRFNFCELWRRSDVARICNSLRNLRKSIVVTRQNACLCGDRLALLFLSTQDTSVLVRGRTTPVLPRPHSYLYKRCRAGFSYRMVLFPGTTAHTDGAHDLTAAFEWDTAGEDHDLAVVRNMNAEKLIA
jgi:hypothetical protein